MLRLQLGSGIHFYILALESLCHVPASQQSSLRNLFPLVPAKKALFKYSAADIPLHDNSSLQLQSCKGGLENKWRAENIRITMIHLKKRNHPSLGPGLLPLLVKFRDLFATKKQGWYRWLLRCLWPSITCSASATAGGGLLRPKVWWWHQWVVVPNTQEPIFTVTRASQFKRNVSEFCFQVQDS